MVLQKLTQYSRAITPHQSKGKIKNFNIAKSIDKIILKKTFWKYLFANCITAKVDTSIQYKEGLSIDKIKVDKQIGTYPVHKKLTKWPVNL